MAIDYDKAASDYAQHREGNRDVLQQLIRDARLSPSSRVLEVGCGTGNHIIALRQDVGCFCAGVEPSEQMLDVARERTNEVDFRAGQAERLDFSGEVFDLVFCVDVIHHVRDRSMFYGEAYRVLDRGGAICTVTESESMLRERVPLARYFPETIDADLKRYPSISDLRQAMEAAGFGSFSESNSERQYPLTSSKAFRDKAFSCLHLISNEALQNGIERMEQDLSKGPIDCVWRNLLLWGWK